jgi:hypothetical protein
MKKSQIGYFIIASAVVWGAVLIACASVLSGTPYKQEVINIIIGGATFHLLFIWAPLGKHFKTRYGNKEKEDSD